MSERKYRQQGYRDQGSGGSRQQEPRSVEPPPRGSMLASRTVSRCAACGLPFPIATSSLEECPNCRAAVHACRQCSHFDASRRFECAQDVPERVADKNARNTCASFSLRVTVERDASPDSTRPSDIRRAFDNLFKK